MAIYNIENLTFTYNGNDDATLKDINLQFDEGGFYIICGKSGSGKSTLLRLLKKEFSLTGKKSGTIYYGGEELSTLDNKKSASVICYLMQDIEGQIVCDKVWKELSFGLGNLGYDDEFIASRVAEVSEYFGISKWYNRKISELSGGSKQILSLASLMTMNPKVLLLDEPTSMLDPIAKKNFVSLLSRINKELGVTVIAIEHNMESMFDRASEVIVLDNGQVVAKEAPHKLISQLAGKEYAKYIGLTEFAEIFLRTGGCDDMPNGIVNQKNWLRENFDNKIDKNTPKIDSNTKKDDRILSAKNLYFRYKKKSEDIVKGANLELNKGEIVCVLGGNGGGKTTFINLLTGIIKGYSGKVKIGKDVKISLLPQNAKGLFVEQSVKDELLVTAKLLKKDISIVDKLMNDFDLNNICDNHPYDISGGEVQRLAIAKLFLTEPDIIILDEPTQGMDMSAKEYLKNLLFEKRSIGVSSIVVTHDLRFASEIADRLGIFFDGKILSLNDAETFFESNSIYTTEASLITKDYYEGSYTVDKVVQLCKLNRKI